MNYVVCFDNNMYIYIYVLWMFARALVVSVFNIQVCYSNIFLPYAKQMRRFALYHEPTALLALCLVLWVEFAGVVDTSRTLKSYVIAGTSRLQSC